MSSAERYAEMRAGARVRERSLLPLPRHCGELELQARWFAGDFGRNFIGAAGEQIEIVQFGTWNRAAGPDFSDCSLRIDGALVRGSIEFDVADQSWEAHGHSTNPAFDETALHVFVHSSPRAFFSRTSAHRNVPQVQVDPTTLPAGFEMHLPLARPGRCHAPLRDLPEEKVRSILDAAAKFRLARKAQRLGRLAELHGQEEVLFQELAAALGYKQNKLAFTLLAQRLPLELLRARLQDDVEAILFGVAGFLETADLAKYESSTRSYLRSLWDRWWPYRSEFERLVLPPGTWHLSGTRPLNHPQRRLAALAALVADWPRVFDSLGAAQLTDSRTLLLARSHPYWDYHYTLSSAPAAKRMALLGESRVTEILANVVLPFRQERAIDVWEDYEKLPARLTNRRLETGAARLFGDDSRRSEFLRTVAHQQGLLQIYEDFCLQDNSDCAHCPFPEQMQKWT